MGERRPSVNRKTTSLVDEFEGFYGRDADKKAIIDMLISDDDNGSTPCVIPILGTGGVGKTILAHHVYNDRAVEERFKVRAWVRVSVQFDVTKVTKEILKQVTDTACPSDDLDQLQVELKKEMNWAKFLLVLDDVRSEDHRRWRQLLTPLRAVAQGSKIIVTTRSKEVASMVQTVPTHHLRELEDEDCWKLLARHACLDVNSTANAPELREIGIETVRKCGGLPLATRALGGVLRRETKVEKWKEVLKSEIWKVQMANILPALAVSYTHLPSHLKRCFGYCAIFPQDYEFQKEELAALWMSEGFLVQRKGHQSLEEIGDIYFDDLVSRSFFERKDDYFVMHDLVHALARFVSGDFCSRLEGGTPWKIGERTRHLSCESLKKSFHETPFLRSFVLAWGPTRCSNKEVIDELLRTWKLLRVLSLSCYQIRELPDSIGNLKHMHHLDLSNTSIKLLPEAVTALFNLEILILRECKELVELPADMVRLINLCQLDLSGTSKLKGMPPNMGKLEKLSKLSDFVVGENGTSELNRLPPKMGKREKLSKLSEFVVGENVTSKLKGMLPKMGKLKKQENLSDFVVGENGGSSIRELGNLHHLRGEIYIRGLENVKDDSDVSEAILKDKENLKVLKLRWCGYADDSRQATEVLERLQPHTDIESIKIWGYGGMVFPNWVGGISFSNLKELCLFELRNCIRLPPLGQLPSLEELSIHGCYNGVLEAIGLEFYGMCTAGEKPFSSLKRLKFSDMKSWREWSSCYGAFPILEELELCDCPELMSVPSHLPSLERLQIRNCGQVKCISVETFPNLKELQISDCSDLESLVGSTATTRRTSDPLFSPSLTSLSISDCSKLVSFPTLHAPNLKNLKIEEWINLKWLPQGMHSLLPSLEELRISYCPEIESFPEGGLPSKLQHLEITVCQKLVGGRLQWGLQSLPSLSNIIIVTDEDVESSFPEETLLPSSVKHLAIGCFGKMKSLNYKGLQHLTSLQALLILGCENLESLPEEGLPSSLSYLEISDCPLLEKRCKRETGEDWPKIKDIPRVVID